MNTRIERIHMLRFWINRMDCIADIADNAAMARCVKRLKLLFLGLAQPMPSVVDLITLNGMEWELSEHGGISYSLLTNDVSGHSNE